MTEHVKAGIANLSDAAFNKLRALIFEKSGISLHDGKKELVRTRLGSRLRKHGFASYEEYYEYVSRDENEFELVNMLDAISTNLTSFFREENHFRFLTQTLIPQMVARKEAERSREIRVWSAGCSSGEEPYSLAFTLLDHIPQIDKYDVKILATDISTAMLMRGSHGLYAEQQIRTVPKETLRRHFTQVTGEEGVAWQVRPEAKRLIQFKRFNLMTPHFPFRRRFDFIFCRNVMIYFDKPTQEKLVGKYHRILDGGGYLMIGHSESLTGITHQFKYVQPTVYQKAG